MPVTTIRVPESPATIPVEIKLKSMHFGLMGEQVLWFLLRWRRDPHNYSAGIEFAYVEVSSDPCKSKWGKKYWCMDENRDVWFYSFIEVLDYPWWLSKTFIQTFSKFDKTRQKGQKRKSDKSPSALFGEPSMAV